MAVFEKRQNNENQNCYQPWQNIQMYGFLLNNPKFPETTEQFIIDMHSVRIYIFSTALLKYELLLNLRFDKGYSISFLI